MIFLPRASAGWISCAHIQTFAMTLRDYFMTDDFHPLVRADGVVFGLDTTPVILPRNVHPMPDKVGETENVSSMDQSGTSVRAVHPC